MSATLLPLPGLPDIKPGDNLPQLIGHGLAAAGLTLQDGDVIAVAQKIVSKAEGRQVALNSVTPTAEAEALAEETGKDPRLVTLILQESRSVVRKRAGQPGVIVVEHLRGWVHANAGIDQSNIEVGAGGASALLLPEDPDRSAAELRGALEAAHGVRLGVLINDSFGRAWRVGTCGIALGASGLEALKDLRGREDRYGRRLEVSVVGLADELAAAASLIMGQAAEGTPVVLLRGFPGVLGDGTAADLIRPAAEDLFR